MLHVFGWQFCLRDGKRVTRANGRKNHEISSPNVGAIVLLTTADGRVLESDLSGCSPDSVISNGLLFWFHFFLSWLTHYSGREFWNLRMFYRQATLCL